LGREPTATLAQAAQGVALNAINKSIEGNIRLSPTDTVATGTKKVIDCIVFNALGVTP
jgi:hypothetical protein